MGKRDDFGFRIADCGFEKDKKGEGFFSKRLAAMKLTADGCGLIAELDWEKQMSGTVEMGGGASH